ncbi:uncharacterized protein LOC111119399 isoform X2 [Crassostrea virginica]
MLLWKQIFIFYLCIVRSDMEDNFCTDNLTNEKACCTDFYMDNNGSCLPCIGFWGKNCANPCSVGFYGHGCRQKCSCDPTQFCDSALGCITRPGDLTSNCGFIKYVYHSLTSAHGINVCYNRATGRIECCKGFTNRTGTCESLAMMTNE